MWAEPIILSLAGIALVILGAPSRRDWVFYAGACLLLLAIFTALLRLASPSCYDGSLVGQALIKACY